MPNLLKIVDYIAEKIKRDYAEDIAIAAYYGSYATGTHNEKSDIDIFFIPKTDKGCKLADCFIVQDIGIDIFPISWKRVKGISEFEEQIVSVIADCKIFFYASSEDLEKFQTLQKMIQAHTQPKKRYVMLQKATKKFQKSYQLHYRLTRTEDIRDTTNRQYVHDFIINLFEVYSLINQQYLKSGWGKNLREIYSFKIQPINFKEKINILINTSKRELALSVCTDLIEETENILKREMAQYNKHKKAADVFNGYYEEIKSTFNKIYIACDTNDHALAYFTTAHLQSEITHLLTLQATSFWDSPTADFNDIEPFYSALHFPDLLSALKKDDLQKLKEDVINLEAKFVHYLQQNGITIKSVDSLEAYRQYLGLK